MKTLRHSLWLTLLLLAGCSVIQSQEARRFRRMDSLRCCR